MIHGPATSHVNARVLFAAQMHSLLANHFADEFMAHIPTRPHKVFSIAQTDGELPKRLLRARRDALPFAVYGVTRSPGAAARARMIQDELKAEGVEVPDSDFHVYESGPSQYCQRHMETHDLGFYIPRLLPTRVLAGDEQQALDDLHNVTCRCVSALVPGGTLIEVVVNSAHQPSQRYRAECVRAVEMALDYARADIATLRTLELPGVTCADSLSPEERGVLTSCVFIVARK